VDLNDLKEELERARVRLGAASCTFYVPDPFWPDELRLIAMPGIQFTEPMHGFSFPPHSKRVIAEGTTEIFSPNVQSDDRLREGTESPLDKIEPGKRYLFGDFVERERIKSSARLLHRANGSIESALFVNFTEKTEFDGPLQTQMRDLLSHLVSKLPALREELRKSETDALVQAIRILPPKHAGLLIPLSNWQQSLETYFSSLLRVAMDALDVNPQTAFGTINLYDLQTGTLRLAAYYGEKAQDTQSTKPLSVLTGEGIISWVAIRRKALLISDLETSEFKNIHVCINQGVRSEIAVPMIAGEELIGVLNLESFLPNAFRPWCVRSLWFAANRAAMAYSLSQQARINSRLKDLSHGLLELCMESVSKSTPNSSLHNLAGLAADQLEASRCEIWHYDTQAGNFKLAGISHSDFHPGPPRPSGWSKFIRALECPVWISEIKTDADFRILHWDDNAWLEVGSEQNPPEKINPSVVDNGMRSLLGTPIKVRDQCIGVAWLEYESNTEIPPHMEIMRLAHRFAAYAGLVIEFSQVDLVGKAAVQRIGDRLSSSLLAPGLLSLDGFPRIEVYVKSQPFPHSRIGGDFYAARVIDEQTASVLVGDGEGHAVTGALNMLPMLSVFEAFWKESRSALHIMDKIMSISNKLGVRGSAIYCVFTLIQQELWLSVTSAAHPFLVVIQDDGGTFAFPHKNSLARGAMLGVKLTLPLAEDRISLSSGDLIIIFTDGLDLDTDEIAAVGLEHKREDSGAIAEAVFNKAIHKQNGESFADDATVLVIRVK
jgi:GAF domain-containing protein